MSKQTDASFSPASRLFRDLTLNFFLDYIPSGSRILDCGAGDGAVSIPLAEKGCVVDALDAQPERIAILNEAKGDLPVRGYCGDFLTHPLEPVYDYVIARQFMGYFEDRWRDVLQRMAGLCKSGGAVIVHMHSSESARIAAEIAVSPRHRAAVERGYPNNASASRDELEQFASSNGLRLERLTPIKFFHPKALFWRAGMDKQQRLNLVAEMDRKLSDPVVYEFARWFEAEVAGNMPSGFAADFMAVLRRC